MLKNFSNLPIDRRCNSCSNVPAYNFSRRSLRNKLAKKKFNYLVRRSSESPMMVFERASLFMEQQHENRKQMRNNNRGRTMWSDKYDHFYEGPSSYDIGRTSAQCSQSRSGSPILLSHFKISDSHANLAESKTAIFSDQDDENDALDELVESTLNLNKQIVEDVKCNQNAPCVFVFLAMLALVNSIRFIQFFTRALVFVKHELTLRSEAFWKPSALSTLLREKRNSKLTLIFLAPLVMLFTVIYPIIWIMFLIHTGLMAPVRPSYLQMFNFKKLMT